MKILCYAPYSAWTLHTSRQVTILHGLRLRGCEISYVTCDGTFAECDMHQPSKGAQLQRQNDTCYRCQASTSEFLYRLGQPFRWLGRWLSPDDYHEALAWSQSIDVHDLQDAHAGDWPIGAWVRSSAHSHFRSDALDFDDEAIQTIYRRYLYSGYLACVGLSKLLRNEPPDMVLIFNGRMAPTRIALELTKQHGIRTLAEERGFVPGFIRLAENSHCLDPTSFYDMCDTWQDVPLSQSELEALDDLLSSHMSGTGFEMPLFAAPTHGAEKIRAQLNLENDSKIVSLFTSSTDESEDQPQANGSFPNQHAWIQKTIELVKLDPSLSLVIRAHPNIGGKRAVGTNTQEIAFIETLFQNLPANVRLVLPEDDLSSFDLMAASDCGLIWHSSLGIEMAALGKPVLRAGAYWFRDADFMISNTNPDTYANAFAQTLDLAAKPISIERVIAAWRFAYCWFFRQSISFPLVKQPDWSSGEPAFKSLNDLRPGRDEALDQICSVIMDGTPLHPQPDSRPPSTATAERTWVQRYVDRFALP